MDTFKRFPNENAAATWLYEHEVEGHPVVLRPISNAQDQIVRKEWAVAMHDGYLTIERATVAEHGLLARRWLGKEHEVKRLGNPVATGTVAARLELEALTAIINAAGAGNLDAVEWLEGRGFISLPTITPPSGEPSR